MLWTLSSSQDASVHLVMESLGREEGLVTFCKENIEENCKQNCGEEWFASIYCLEGLDAAIVRQIWLCNFKLILYPLASLLSNPAGMLTVNIVNIYYYNPLQLVRNMTSSNHHNSGGLHVKKFFKTTISQLRALATHTPSLGRVAQGALELCLPQIRKCHFLSDPCVFGYIF